MIGVPQNTQTRKGAPVNTLWWPESGCREGTWPRGSISYRQGDSRDFSHNLDVFHGPSGLLKTSIALENSGSAITTQLFRGPRMEGWIRRGWLSRFWGAPRPNLHSRGPKTLIVKGSGTSKRKIGAPQKSEIQPRRIQPPILGPLKLSQLLLTPSSSPNQELV